MVNMMVTDPRNLPIRSHNLKWITYHSIDEDEDFKPISTLDESWAIDMKESIKKQNFRVYDQALYTDILIPCGYYIRETSR